MNAELINEYQRIENYSTFIERNAGVIEVFGKEAVGFLNGLITNDIGKLDSDSSMEAAFPNAQGRLLAFVRVFRFGEKFVFVTDQATREKVFQNLFRFTFAGDFFVEDLSEKFACFSLRNTEKTNFPHHIPNRNEVNATRFDEESGFTINAVRNAGIDFFVPLSAKESFAENLKELKFKEISAELDEILRIESGVPKSGVDADETTIVPELGIDEAISYNKGCYIGQEIIARIHFRGHVAKQLTGLIFEDEDAAVKPSDELKTPDGKNAGRVTSITFSPQLGKKIALAYVRYDYLAEGTKLNGGDFSATVKNLPFVGGMS